MTRVGIVLYGAPAAGKDTVSAELMKLDHRFEHFERIKVGSGNSAKYRMASATEVDTLRQRGAVVYENERYGNVYVVDRPGLDAVFERGHLPIIHMGQVVGAEAVIASGGTWIGIALVCDAGVAVARMRARGDNDIETRIVVWEETLKDLAEHGLGWARETIDTGLLPAAETAARIAQLVKEVEDAEA